MTQKNQSVYTRILEALKNGSLPRGFSLDLPDQSGIRFLPGAKDGILCYHTAHQELSDEVFGIIGEAIRNASENDEEAAYSQFLQLTQKYPAYVLWDAVQDSIIDQKDHLNQSNVFSFAIFRLILEGTDIECVKIGIIITEIFSEPVPKFKEVLRNLALYEEFTLYVISHMRNWQDRDLEMFEIAKKVTGWGRIFAAESMEPVNQEISDWFLYEGYKNDVLYNYSALTACLKSNLIFRLRNHTLSDSDYHAASRLIIELTDETPLGGLSEFSGAEELLELYLDEASFRPLTQDEYSAFDAVSQFEGNVENLSEIKKKYAEILRIK